MRLDNINHIQNETAWSTRSDGKGTGGGTSNYELEPDYQRAVQQTGFRTSRDVAFVADPGSGVPIYNSFMNSGWMQIGGTSLSCPAWGGLIATANQGRTLQHKATFNSSSNPQ